MLMAMLMVTAVIMDAVMDTFMDGQGEVMNIRVCVITAGR